MMQSPVKKIFITQVFGANPASYAKFGYKGHNGIDFRAFLPNGERCFEGGKSEVFAPHEGTILENVNDVNGYGWYIKIGNDREGSVLGHFSHQSPCVVGSKVSRGQFVGYQGTTGNSTGIHLHWGYYMHPRDRNNGYGGYINQEGMYGLFNEPLPPLAPVITEQTRIPQIGNMQVDQIRSILNDQGRDIEEFKKQIQVLKDNPKIVEVIKEVQVVVEKPVEVIKEVITEVQVETVKFINPEFKNSLAQLIYQLALSLEGKAGVSGKPE